MNEPVPHTGSGSPRHIRMIGADVGTDVLRSLANNLDQLRQREPEQFVVVEVGPAAPCAVRDGLRRSNAEMPQSDLGPQAA